ncbi:hypothetical protein ACETU7_15130 [Rhodococcus sp. 3Y1]
MVPNIPVGFLTNQDGLLDQRGDEIEHFGRIHVLPTHALSGVEVEPTENTDNLPTTAVRLASRGRNSNRSTIAASVDDSERHVHPL